MDDKATFCGGLLLAAVAAVAGCASTSGAGEAVSPQLDRARQDRPPATTSSAQTEASSRNATVSNDRVGGDDDSNEGSRAPDESSDDDQGALYWAKRSVNASRRVAYGAGVRETAKKHPDALADSDTDVTSPNGRWVLGKSTPQPDTNNSSKTTASTRSVSANSGNDAASADSDAGSRGWPVGFPGSNGDDSSDGLVDPRLDKKVFELDKKKQRKKVADKFGIDPPNKTNAVAISGPFVENLGQYDRFEHLEPKQLKRQVVVVVPGEKVTLYAGATEIDTRTFPDDVELPEKLQTVRPVRTVRDGTVQLLLYWGQPAQDGSDDDDKSSATEYRVGVLKTIGPHIGTVFERTVAVASEDSDSPDRSGYVEFLTGDKHRAVRWIPAGADGKPAPTQAIRLEWNKWEGVYRVPRPPPTAPDDRS